MSDNSYSINNDIYIHIYIHDDDDDDDDDEDDDEDEALRKRRFPMAISYNSWTS